MNLKIQNEGNKKKPNIYGLTARFENEEKFINAIHLAAEARYSMMEIYSPFQIQGLENIPGHHETHVQWAVFFGGLTGGITGFFMQYYANVIDYPQNIGGRPFNSWPAFVPIMFEMAILFAALSGFTAFLISCRLPRLNHPMFNSPEFTMDNFFLCIRADDTNFNLEQTRKFLEKTEAISVYEVEHDE